MSRLPVILATILLLPVACAAPGNTTNTVGPKTPAVNAANKTSVVDDSRFTLGLGQSIQLSDGSELVYTSLIDDSRCPPAVQCVWAGDAEIALRWKPTRGSSQELRLHTSPLRGGATSARIGARTLSLVTLERGIGPKATLSIEAAP